jgi:hypothetical protein
MIVAEMPKSYVYLERAESSRLAWALAISLAVHLLTAGAYYAEQKVHWMEAIHLPAWVKSSQLLARLFPKHEVQPPRQPQEAPLMFVEVNPAQATAEPPKDAKYYSSKNSQAANKQADQETGIPKITGTQIEVAKTEDVPREKFVPLQPTPPVPQPQENREEQRAKPAQTPGDMAVGKPDPKPSQDDGQAEHTRPRTLAEARARQSDYLIPGPRMKQEGGVRHHAELSSLDAKATPFGAYDAALVEAISQRWFTLLDERQFASDGRGKVVLHFALHYDGRITDVKVADNTAGDMLGLICEKAILDPAPFAPWPSDMRHMLDSDVRLIQFTFYYN